MITRSFIAFSYKKSRLQLSIRFWTVNVDDIVIYSEQKRPFNDFFVSQTKLENNNQECPLPPVYNFREHLTDIELNTGDIR